MNTKRNKTLSPKLVKMLADRNKAKPSETENQYWIYAERQQGEYPEYIDGRNGKWLVFVHFREVDSVWEAIKKATEEGLLGSSAKVSTRMSNSNSSNPEEHVICVYTYDSTDREDVTRIREELRKLGIIRKIPYKTDEATHKGIYYVTGHRRISTYFE